MMDAARAIRKFMPVVLTAAIGIVASSTLFLIIGQYERTVLLAEFERRAEQRVAIIQAELADHFTFIDGLGGLYAASHNVERSEFYDYLDSPLIHAHASQHVTAWVPRVSQADRPAYEDAARKDGLSGFMFTQQAADGTLVPAMERDVYLPLFYIDHDPSHGGLLGFDLASAEHLHNVLERSRDTGMMTTTHNFSFPAMAQDQRVFMALRPNYAQHAPTGTIEERRANFKGFIAAFFRVSDMVNNTLKHTPAAGLHFLIREDASPLTNGDLYFHSSRSGQASQAQVLGQMPDDDILTLEIKLHGLKWMVDFWPAAAFLETQRVWTQWLMLISGVFLTTLISALISVAILKREAIQKAKALIEASEIKYRAILNQAPDAILMVAQDQHLIEVNKKAEELFGYSRQELLTKSLQDLHPKSELDKLETAFRNGVESGQNAEVLNSAIIGKDGRIVPIDLTGTVVIYGDEMLLMGNLRDISARKEMESNLLQAQKLSALAHMISGIAHELNNMLVPIQSLTNMTVKRLPEDSKDRARLSKVAVAAERASETVRKLVAFTRWSEPKFENLPITDFMKDALEKLGSTIPSTITVNTDIEDCDAVVRGDRSQLQSVLFNIVDNAVDAMEGRTGDLALMMADIELTTENENLMSFIEPGRYIRLTIQDWGIGMDADTVSKIFDPFFTTKSVGQGTGLGLSTAYGIVAKHGGAIAVESTLGRGSKFEVYLPVIEYREH